MFFRGWVGGWVVPPPPPPSGAELLKGALGVGHSAHISKNAVHRIPEAVCRGRGGAGGRGGIGQGSSYLVVLRLTCAASVPGRCDPTSKTDKLQRGLPRVGDHKPQEAVGHLLGPQNLPAVYTFGEGICGRCPPS